MDHASLERYEKKVNNTRIIHFVSINVHKDLYDALIFKSNYQMKLYLRARWIKSDLKQELI